MEIQVWSSSDMLSEWIIDKTILSDLENSNNDFAECSLEWRILPESDASNPRTFHAVPDHIKDILYLDAPDLIVEVDGDPIFSVEISTEAGTGHNTFQRFGRLMAAIENQVPAFYIYPIGVFVRRRKREGWDLLNPNIYKAMEKAMQIHQVPALLFQFPTCYPEHPSDCVGVNSKGIFENQSYPGCPYEDEEIEIFFEILNDILNKEIYSRSNSSEKTLLLSSVQEWREKMQNRRVAREREMGSPPYSPITATIEVPTHTLLTYLKQFTSNSYSFKGKLLKRRDTTVIYEVRAKYRHDPYPGALAGIDYLLTRTGKTYEDRDKNLAISFGTVNYDQQNEILEIEPRSSRGSEVNIEQFTSKINNVADKFILDKRYADLDDYEIPRFYMQARHGTSYTLTKAERMYTYFADAVLFGDGAVWREG